MRDVVSANFTSWDMVAGDRASPCCDACEAVFRDFRFRSTALIATAGGVAKYGPDDLRAIVANPPSTPFVLTWPSSRKKHCWLNARLSTETSLNIGGDDRTHSLSIVEARTLLDCVSELFGAGATKTEVRVGVYRPLVSQRLGHRIEVIENCIRPARASGALDIITWAIDREPGAGKGDIVMLDDRDRRAAELLARLANGSAMRDSDPIGFWGRGYLVRLNRRTGARDMRAFLEAMAADLAIRSVALREILEWLDAKPDSELDDILARIKASPRVLVALAQDAAKSARKPGIVAASHKARKDDLDDPLTKLLGDNT